MVNIKTVAKEAGVSISTVSNVFNGRTNVGPKTKKLVLETSRRLHYIPSVIASGNITKQTNIIGLFFDIGSSAYDNIYNELLEGSILEAANYGKRILPYFGIKDSKELLSILRAGCQPIDSAIILSPQFDDLRMNRLSENSIPYLIIGNPGVEHPNTPYIDIDNEKASYQITDNLIKLGHKEIVMINYKLGYYLTEDRQNGYLSAYRDNALNHNPNLTFYCGLTEEDGYNAVDTLIKNGESFSAIIVSMPIVAKGVYAALKDNGLSVGKDVSVICFVKDTFDLKPKLSYGKFDYRVIGREAVKGVINISMDTNIKIAKTMDIKMCYYESCSKKK